MRNVLATVWGSAAAVLMLAWNPIAARADLLTYDFNGTYSGATLYAPNSGTFSGAFTLDTTASLTYDNATTEYVAALSGSYTVNGAMITMDSIEFQSDGSNTSIYLSSALFDLNLVFPGESVTPPAITPLGPLRYVDFLLPTGENCTQALPSDCRSVTTVTLVSDIPEPATLSLLFVPLALTIAAFRLHHLPPPLDAHRPEAFAKKSRFIR